MFFKFIKVINLTLLYAKEPKTNILLLLPDGAPITIFFYRRNMFKFNTIIN